MSQETVYQWMEQIARYMPGLGKWQVKGLALFSLGVIWSERSTLTKVAEKPAVFGQADSLDGACSAGWPTRGWISRCV